MAHFFAQILAFLVAVSQLLVSPFAAVTLFQGAPYSQTPTATPTMTGLGQAMSPSVLSGSGYKQMWFSGKVEANESVGSIYRSYFLDNKWSQPQKVFSVPGFVISDPSVIEDPSHPGQLLLFYSSISEADATSTTKMKENNRIGMARSVDYGTTWQDVGIVIGQNNGLDSRGGWSPSALVVQNEIWLYYSTNYPGAVEVYRSRLRSSDYRVVGTDRMYDIDNQKNLEGIHAAVIVDASVGNYVMYLNKDFSGISSYISSDGVRWWWASQDKESLVVQPSKNSLVAAPYAEIAWQGSDEGTTINLFFAGGSVATKTFDSLQVVSNISRQQTYIPYQNTSQGAVLPTNNTTNQSAATSSGGGGGGGGSSGLLIAGLGIAAVVGLAFLLAPAAAAPAAAVSLTNPFSFGGRVILIAPCLSVLGPSIWVTLLPASPLLPPYMYIWTPATLLNLVPPSPSIPPTHIGQQIMGRFDIPYACVIPIPPFVLYGLRMQTVGVSPL